MLSLILFQVPKNIRITSGTSTATIGGNIHNIKKVVNHELYIRGKYDHDIALLFVKESFKFSSIVQPINLPTKELTAGTLAMAAGYGQTDPQVNVLVSYHEN